MNERIVIFKKQLKKSGHIHYLLIKRCLVGRQSGKKKSCWEAMRQINGRNHGVTLDARRFKVGAWE